VTDSDPDSNADADADRRHATLDRHPTAGPRNSLWHWPDAKHPLRVVVNYLAVWAIRLSPSLRAKNWLLRRLGATVGPGVAVGLEATPDVFWPELLTIRANAIVGYDATLLCHEFLQAEYRTGEVVVGERAMIGAGAVVLPGVDIGADAKVAANSLVTADVQPGTTVAGVPARPVDGGVGEGEGEGEEGSGRADAASDAGA
jgi:acetyltransferase-like isoleucine patch superfamily enzyme